MPRPSYRNIIRGDRQGYSFGVAIGAGVTLSEFNRRATFATASSQVRSLIPLKDKQHFEFDWITLVGDCTYIGIVGANFVAAPSPLGDNNSWCVYQGGGPGIYGIALNVNTFTLKASAITTSDTLVLETDVDDQQAQLWAKVNQAGQWNGSATADPVLGVGGYAFTSIGPGPYYLAMECGTSTGNVARMNDGYRPFTVKPSARFPGSGV